MNPNEMMNLFDEAMQEYREYQEYLNFDAEDAIEYVFIKDKFKNDNKFNIYEIEMDTQIFYTQSLIIAIHFITINNPIEWNIMTIKRK